jgi:hypothetical protein
MSSSSLLTSVLGRASPLFHMRHTALLRGGPPMNQKKKPSKNDKVVRKHKINVRKQLDETTTGDKGNASMSSRRPSNLYDDTDAMMRILQPTEKRTLAKVTEEEMRQRTVISKVWSMWKMRLHHQQMGALHRFIQTRIKAMQALEALHPNLARQAKEVDPSTYPMWKGPPSLTPPVIKPWDMV